MSLQQTSDVFEGGNDTSQTKQRRRDMMDDALLRPGRLEVQIEIGLPKEKGRTQILHIHTKKVIIISSS